MTSFLKLPRRAGTTLTGVLALVALVASCDRPPTTASDLLVGIQAAAGAPVSFKRVIHCTRGGTFTMHGAAPDQTNSKGTGRVSLNAVLEPKGCRWATTEGVIQLDGQPNLVLHGSRDVVEGVLSNRVSATLKGKASWTVSGRTTQCTVDATYQLDASEPLLPQLGGDECERVIFRKFFALD